MGRVAKLITFDEERDADLLAWLDGQANQSAAVRAALRAYIRLNNGEGREATVKEVVEAVLLVLRETVAAAMMEALANYRIPVAAEYDGDEDPELAARLDAQLEEWK
ncbi:MAG: hypothetical protein RML46_09260 [Anaerolineae bacterium]|nr:hypothetical protein [Anaerolineae bacterium]